MTPLIFKDNLSAFGYACEFMQSTLSKGALLPALVLDGRELAGTAYSVSKDSKGVQTAFLMVCSSDGGFILMAQTASANGPVLKTGDLVIWQAGKYMKRFGKLTSDTRFGWVGLILGTIEPEWSDDRWVGKELFQ